MKCHNSRTDPFNDVTIIPFIGHYGKLHHRVIFGDDGRGGMYRLEKGGNGLSPIRQSFLSYRSLKGSVLEL